MKTGKTLLYKLGLAVALAGLGSSNAYAVDVSGTATVEVITPLIITETTPMNFGQVSGSGTAGNIVLSGNTATPDTNTSVVPASGAADAVFDISGEPSQNIVITDFTGASATLDDGAAGAAMTVDTFTYTAPTVLDGSGNASFSVGATLHLNANQAAGTYDTSPGNGGSTYTVTVNYN
jgi:hypothetical protein